MRLAQPEQSAEGPASGLDFPGSTPVYVHIADAQPDSPRPRRSRRSCRPCLRLLLPRNRLECSLRVGR